MTPISNVPQGLISLLGLRDMGAVPRQVPETLSASFDVIPLLLLNREVQGGQALFSTINSVPLITVPAGELWYVHAFGISSGTLLAGETITICPGFIQEASFIEVGPCESAVAGARAGTGAYTSMWLPPGSQLAARTNQITTGASITVLGRALVSRLRI